MYFNVVDNHGVPLIREECSFETGQEFAVGCGFNKVTSKMLPSVLLLLSAIFGGLSLPKLYNEICNTHYVEVLYIA